jgi:hydrogenase nickel incorporation protein HypA/HybF
MHELSLMQSLCEQVVGEAQRHQAERVTCIRLRVGALAGVDPQALRFAAEVVLVGTCAQGARLEIEDVPATFWCSSCRKAFETGDGVGLCLACGRISAKLLRGRELILTSLELNP